MLSLGVKNQYGVFKHFVLESIDLNDGELLVKFGRILDTQRLIMNN